MAFGKKKHRFLKRFVKVGVIVTILVALVGVGYFFHLREVNDVKAQWAAQVSDLTAQAQALEKMVLVPKEPIKKGTVLEREHLKEVLISTSISRSDFIDYEDVGKVLLVDVESDVPIFKSMVYEEVIGNDLREEELNMLLLPSQLEKGTYIDVRICFPNGEDYIVLSKKKVQDVRLKENTIWLWMDEMELMTINSAILDAYIHKGTKLYTVSYIEPNLQEEAVVSYPVNQEVIKAMQANPNLLQEAKAGLQVTARQALDERLMVMNDEVVSRVENGVLREETERESAVVNGASEQDLPPVAPANSGINNVEDEDESIF